MLLRRWPMSGWSISLGSIVSVDYSTLSNPLPPPNPLRGIDMRKTLVIVIREYLAAVRTKSFLVVLLLMPVLMGGGIIAQTIFQKMEDTGEKHFAIVDRTPGEKLFAAIEGAARVRNS